MQRFAELYRRLDETTSTNEKVAVLKHYFDIAPDADKIWTLSLLSGRSLKRSFGSTLLKNYAIEFSGLPYWLFEASYEIVGDLAETLSKIIPPPKELVEKSLSEWMKEIKGLNTKTEEEKRDFLLKAWSSITSDNRFIFNKLLTGGFRVGVSQKLLVKALAQHCRLDENKLAHRIMGKWEADSISYQDLIFTENPATELSRPYPFYLSYALEDELADLGSPAEWQAEWKWDGIRGQLIARKNEIYIWSRGEELVTERFPELHILKDLLPSGTVLDGELIPWKNECPLPFHLLQTRIGRKTISKKLLEEVPIILLAYDVLEWEGKDVREFSLSERRKLLDSLHSKLSSATPLLISPALSYSSWDELQDIRAKSRSVQSEGLMLKKLDSIYEVGRKRGSWWKWKLDPYSIDAVLIYAQAGHGRRANLYTDYTFALWNEGVLMPFAKAYSGLSDAEIKEVDDFVKKHTLEKFGPVRSVEAKLVFELGFEGINLSTRHRSGVAVRFPRILRWRQDKTAAEANTLDDLKALLT